LWNRLKSVPLWIVTERLKRCPATRSDGVFELHFVARRGPRDSSQRRRKPHKHFAELQPVQPERLAHRDLTEDVEISPFNSDRKERERFALLAGSHQRSRMLPAIGRLSVTDHKNPWAVIRNTILFIGGLAFAHHFNRSLDCNPHRCITLSIE